ncbi:hypothetical protein [Desulfosporosinus sp. SB140]|uniref:hypothetical protein n=1 Tax=Desulfosporosinus paludis TaxID=3115649 RepID=UPI003890BEE4
MSIILMVLRSIFIISVALYLYYFTKRKKHNVSIYLWVIIIVGMTSGLLIQLLGVYLGTAQWSSIQISSYFYLALIIYSIWKLIDELKKRGQ